MESTVGSKKNTRVIAIGNQKGGVGKSTNTVNLAAALGELGRKCLVVDLDANCGATRSLGIPTTWMGTFEVFLGLESAEHVVLRNDPVDDIVLPQNVDLLPGTRKLEEIDRVFRERRENKFLDPTDGLKRPLEELAGEYDYIFLDTAPNASSPTIAAYKSAEWFILSMTPEKLAYEALMDALTDILAVRDGANPDLRLLGVVLTQLDKRTRQASLYTERIRKEFGDAGQQGAFETTISRSVVVPKSDEAGKSLFELEPDHKVTHQYRALAKEVEDRIDSVVGGALDQKEVLTPQAAPASEAVATPDSEPQIGEVSGA